MNKKRLWITVAAILLCICSVIIFIACKKNNEDSDTSDTAEEIPDISLLEDGAFVYRIIRSDSGKGNAVTVCATLKKTLKTVTGADIEVLTDFEDKDSNDDIREILVGSTNRQASIDAMNDLGANEYIIRVTGNKIVIAGGSDEMLTMAVKQFLLNCAGYVSDADYTATDRITIKGNFELRNRIKEADKDIVILKTNDTISYVDRLVASVEGFHPKDKIRVAGLNDNMSTIFSTDKTELVIVAGADTITGQCRYALDQYLYKKGRVLMLGGPAFEKVTYLSDGKFLTLSEYLRSEYGKLTDDRKLTVFDTSDETAHSAFVRSRNPGSGVNNWDNGGWFSYGDFGFDSESGKQMKVRLTNLQSAGWAYDAFRCPFEADNAYKSKVNAIGFWAKSDEAEPTTGVVLELVDSQGVAWYAKVELTSEWQYYMFSAEDFSYYENRGNVATASSPQFAGIRSIGFGLDNAVFAQTQGNHAYYLTEVELLVMDSDMLNYIRDIDLDSVSPYTSVQYSITNGASIETYANQIFVTDRDYVLAEELVSCQPGTQGTGYNKGRYYRFIPLLEIKDAGGFHSGYAAWINLYSRTTSSTDREGAIVGYFSSCSADFYDVNGILAVADAAKAMSRDVFLIEGGSDEYTYIPEDTSEITVGGAYVDLSRYKDAEVTLAVELFDGDTLLGTYTSDSDLNSAPLFNGAMTFRNTFSISKERPNHVVTTLKADGVIVDRIEQTIDYWEAKPESERNYVYVEDGYYKRNGEIINVIGVNYWPSYHLALQYYNGEFDTRAKYDPDVVRADLARIKELGMTSVALSLFAYNVGSSNNMLDLVRICEDMGLYVDLAIRSRNDYKEEFLYFDKEDADQLVLRLHFNENDNIIAYDMCWERRIGTYEGDAFGIGRKRYDSIWEKWIISQYGSVKQAEKLWGVSAPRDSAGNVIGPSDAMLNDGGASAMICAYYRFLDDIVAKEFNEFKQYLLTIDPNHLLSFRMQNAGSAVNPSEGNYDFQSLASIMDFMAPEGYSVVSGEESMIQLMFMAAYARYCKPDAPVLMKEFASNVSTGSTFALKDNPTAVQAAAYLEEFMEYMYNSEMSAFYLWWYPSGLRTAEKKNDCGLFEMDGSDRLTTEVLRKWVPKFTERRERTKECVVIEIERDDTGLGIKGMFNKAKDQLLAAYRNGKNVVFVNKQQTKANEVFYADEVLNETVGGTKAIGSYPLRYVNGQIKNVVIYRENGLRYAKVTVCNTGHATWRAGAVSLTSTDNSDVRITPAAIEKDVGYLEEIEMTVLLQRMGDLELRFIIDGIEFGMVYETSL